MYIIFSILVAFLIIFVIIRYKYKLCVAHDNQVKNNIIIAKKYLSKIKNANSLDELYCIFREIIESLDVSFILNPYGIFRAKSLESCRSTDIYLGNIYGLWTFTLNEWMQSKDIEAVKLITNQFKNQLINTLNTYIKNEKDK